tara:strand:+ start:96 stop:1022 length:927 start_codon:yes stop_codon:yes gene_type:complete
MAFTTTSNFAGKAAGFYIAASLKEAKSLDFLTMIENIKYKSNIQRMAGSSVVVDATCDFTSAGTLALTEKVLEPRNLQINLDLCKSTLLDSWEALQMRAGAGAPPPASFDDYVISYMGEIIAQATEDSIWNGAGATGDFQGFLNTNGYLMPTGTNADTTVIQSSASGAYSAANIIANLQTLVADIAGNAPTILGKEDLHIYMNNKTFSYYISAISSFTGTPWGSLNTAGDYEPVFEGYRIAVCPGMLDNQVVAAQKSNLYYGTDLLSDATRITLMDMAALDGSDNMRLVARYSGGVQSGVGADIVRQS